MRDYYKLSTFSDYDYKSINSTLQASKCLTDNQAKLIKQLISDLENSTDSEFKESFITIDKYSDLETVDVIFSDCYFRYSIVIDETDYKEIERDYNSVFNNMLDLLS